MLEGQRQARILQNRLGGHALPDVKTIIAITFKLLYVSPCVFDTRIDK